MGRAQRAVRRILGRGVPIQCSLNTSECSLTPSSFKEEYFQEYVGGLSHCWNTHPSNRGGGYGGSTPSEIPPDIVKRDHGGITERQMTEAILRKCVRVVSKILRDTLRQQTRNLLWAQAHREFESLPLRVFFTGLTPGNIARAARLPRSTRQYLSDHVLRDHRGIITLCWCGISRHDVRVAA